MEILRREVIIRGTLLSLAHSKVSLACGDVGQGETRELKDTSLPSMNFFRVNSQPGGGNVLREGENTSAPEPQVTARALLHGGGTSLPCAEGSLDLQGLRAEDGRRGPVWPLVPPTSPAFQNTSMLRTPEHPSSSFRGARSQKWLRGTREDSGLLVQGCLPSDGLTGREHGVWSQETWISVLDPG